jgi:hypothetical protein
VIYLSERLIEKQRAKFDEAADTMSKAAAQAALISVAYCVATETGAADQASRAVVAAEGRLRLVIDPAGRLVASVARSAIDPFAPGAFDEAVFHVGRLLATAWRARAGAAE